MGSGAKPTPISLRKQVETAHVLLPFDMIGTMVFIKEQANVWLIEQDWWAWNAHPSYFSLTESRGLKEEHSAFQMVALNGGSFSTLLPFMGGSSFIADRSPPCSCHSTSGTQRLLAQWVQTSCPTSHSPKEGRSHHERNKRAVFLEAIWFPIGRLGFAVSRPSLRGHGQAAQFQNAPRIMERPTTSDYSLSGQPRKGATLSHN